MQILKKILKLLGYFNVDWRIKIEFILIDEYKAVFDSVIALRHKIVHGEFVNITYVRIKKYFDDIFHVIEYIRDVCILD